MLVKLYVIYKNYPDRKSILKGLFDKYLATTYCQTFNFHYAKDFQYILSFEELDVV